MKFIDFGCFMLASTPWVRNRLGVNIDGISSTSTVPTSAILRFFSADNLVSVRALVIGRFVAKADGAGMTTAGSCERSGVCRDYVYCDLTSMIFKG